MSWLLITLAAVPAVVWLYALLLVPRKAADMPKFSALPLTDECLPELSIVIAARNEAHKIEAALTSLLVQDYPDYEILVVNDRSDDGTGDILRRMENAHDHLRVIHVETLPEAWLGKNHALQKGFEATCGEFVLFTDADVHFAPNTLRRAVHYMQSHKLDHLASIPHLINAKPSMRLIIPAFSVFFLMNTQPWRINDPNSDKHIGVGAFNMVRRSALQEAGGFEPKRLRPDDDLMLGKLLKSTGHKPGYVMSDEQVAVEWYTTGGETIRGLEKNAFAHFDYRPGLTSALMLAALYLSFMPIVGILLLPSLSGWLSLCALTGMLGFAMYTTRLIKMPVFWGLLFPIGSLMVVYATLRSMFLTLKRGGIIWRDTFYPLEQLRGNRL